MAGALPKWGEEPVDAGAGIEALPDVTGGYSVPAAPAPPPPTAPQADPFAAMYSAPARRQVSLGSAESQLDAVVADDELQRNIASADAALAQRGGAQGFEDVAAGQAAGAAGAYGDALGNWMKFAPRSGSKYNVMRPFAERRVAERTDQTPEDAEADYDSAFPFRPEPFMPLPRYQDESDEDYAARMQIFADADYRSQLDEHQRKKQEWLASGSRDLATLDTRAIGREPGAIGMEEAQRQGQENVDAAKEAQDAELAREQAIAAGKQADATMMVAAQQEEQRAREEAGFKAVEKYRSARDQARKSLAAMRPVAREEVARGLSTGTKIAAVLGAIGQGWRGDAVTAVNDAIDRGVAEKLDLYERRRTEMGDIIGQADEAMGMLDFITNSVGGNRETSAAMLRSMTMEDTIADIAAKEAATSVPVLKAQYKQMRTALEQQLRDETMAEEMKLAKTPERIGYRIDTPLMKLMRRESEAAMKDARVEGMDIRKEYRAEAAKVGERAAAIDLERVKGEGAVAAKRAEATAKTESDIKMKSATFGAVEQQIDDILENTGNIHGRGMAWTGESDERITTSSQLIALQQSLTQAFTGATATPEQQAAFEELVQGDWSELSDDALRARLRALKNIVSSQRRYLTKELGSPDKTITNPRELSSFQPR